ncbi:dnaJ homolog subfamily C member 28 [Protopterus annectens]|uniref:dnaJ homolog subfamily C member 28 n=1 Tax=Protopterus annectens TaxID=7888 RepID=UPI001CFA9069|nr:dnaJ homolog subfamily C member 28 [Protopterus annectens]
MKWLCLLTRKPACLPLTNGLVPCQSLLRHSDISEGQHVWFSSMRNMNVYYGQLHLQEGCSLDDAKAAYLRLAKKYHPDSASATANALKFSQVKEAYRAVLMHINNGRKTSVDEDEEERPKYKTPQHRQYLDFEGVGFGPPSQREKQYMQLRLDRASEQVLDYRKQKLENQDSDANSLVVSDIRHSKKIKITQAIERLVEDLIQESMARGDFENLSGQGKPLQKFEHSLHIDPMTHNLNRILLENGYQPPWIMLQKEIRDTIDKLRNELFHSRKKFGDPLNPYKEKQWNSVCEKFKEAISKLNKRVNDYNLVVPLLNRQMVHFSAEKEIVRALKDYRLSVEEAKKHNVDEKDNVADSLKSKSSLIQWLNEIMKRV